MPVAPELPSDVLTVGRAVRGPGGRRSAALPAPQEELTIDIPLTHPDEATMLRSFLSVGAYQRVVESEGEEKIRAAVEPFRTPDGGYRFRTRT